MNVQDEIKALKERISQLEKLAREFPQNGDEYWFIDEEGSVGSTLYDNHYIDNYYIDRRHQIIGNFFQTKEEAEFTVEKLKVEAELRKFSRPFEEDGNNYTINYHHKNKEVVDIYENTSFQMQGAFYFETRDDLEQAIQSVGEERIKKYIFGVED